MKRVSMVLAAMIVCTPVIVLAQFPPSGSRAGNATPRNRRAKADLRRFAAAMVLEKRIDSVEWDETAFEEVVDWLREQGPVNVLVRWQKLEDEGLDRDSPVTLQMRDTTVSEVLKGAMEQLGDGDTVRYQGEGNVIRISTQMDFNSKLYVRVYDILDVLMRFPNFGESAPNVDITQPSGGGGGGGGQGPPVFSGGGSQGGDSAGDEETQQAIDELVALIEATIEPQTWTANGGLGTVTVYNNKLIINNTIDVHEKIGGRFIKQ